MKILVLSDDFPPDVAGGAGVMAFRISKEFVRQGHEVFVLAATANREKVGVHSLEGLSVEYFHSVYHERWRSYVSLLNPAGLRAIKRVLRKYNPDVVHAHNVHAHISYSALSLAKKAGKKVFMTAHDIMSFYPGTFTEFINPSDFSCPQTFNYRVTAGTMYQKFRLRFNPFRNVFIRQVLRKIDGVIAVSDALKDALSQNNIAHVSVIKNGIDTKNWQIPSADATAFKSKFADPASKVVLFGGRLSGSKGGELILLAMQQVIQRVPGAILFVAGRKDFYADRMIEKTETLNIAKSVVFTGWLGEDEMKKAYASSNVVVTPSVCFDSFPNTNLEAFAAGKPAIATCFGGSREVVHDGENGYIVNPFDVMTLAEKISDLLQNEEKAQSFGLQGKQLVEKEFLIKDTAKQYLDLFSK